jgi:hypothetical protein
LSGVDVKGVLRTRLPLVVSLFLAALLGAPTAAGPVADPLPAPVTVAAVAAPAAHAPAPVVVEAIVAEPPAAPAAPVRPVPLAVPLLTDQVNAVATGPRGPPRIA